MVDTTCPVCKTDIKVTEPPDERPILCCDISGNKKCHEPLPSELVKLIMTPDNKVTQE